MSIMHTTGRILGQSAAYAFEGTRLASTQLAHGVREGYAERAETLRAQRLALSAAGEVPLVRLQRKVAVAKA